LSPTTKHHAYSYKHAGKVKAKLRREVARLMKLAEKADNEPVPDLDIPAEIARRESLIARIDKARATIEAREAERHAAAKALHAERLAQRREQQRRTGKKPKGPRPKAPKLCVEPTAQVNLTDEESRIMPTADGFIQGYNAQAVVTMGSQLVISTGVAQATNDKQQLIPVLEQLQTLPATLGAVTAIAADAGYYSEANVQACAGAGITPFWRCAAKPITRGSLQSCERPIPSQRRMPPRSSRWRIAYRPKTDVISMRSARAQWRQSLVLSRAL